MPDTPTHAPTHAQAPPTTGRVIRWARWYDLATRLMSFGRIEAIRRTFVGLAAPAPGEKVLDVGCGTGALALALKDAVGAAGEVHGIDAAPEMIEVARGKAARSGAAVDFQVALIEAIPFPDASFDLATTTLVMHHLPDDLARRGIAEIRRVLKPGGRLVILDFATPGHSPVGHVLAFLGRSHGKGTVARLTPMLAEAGFAGVEALSTRHRRFAFVRAPAPASAAGA